MSTNHRITFKGLVYGQEIHPCECERAMYINGQCTRCLGHEAPLRAAFIADNHPLQAIFPSAVTLGNEVHIHPKVWAAYTQSCLDAASLASKVNGVVLCAETIPEKRANYVATIAGFDVLVFTGGQTS